MTNHNIVLFAGDRLTDTIHQHIKSQLPTHIQLVTQAADVKWEDIDGVLIIEAEGVFVNLTQDVAPTCKRIYVTPRELTSEQSQLLTDWQIYQYSHIPLDTIATILTRLIE